jgi:hypothetical protein
VAGSDRFLVRGSFFTDPQALLACGHLAGVAGPDRFLIRRRAVRSDPQAMVV